MTRGDCESIRPLISAALDGELDDNEFVRLSEHLASCPDCHQAYLDYSQLRDELRSASAPTPPAHLTRSIRRETVEKPPPPLVVQLASRAGLKFGATTVAASLVILFALGVLGYLGYDQRSSPAVTGSQPAQEVIEDWPISQPIEIEFSKPMNQASVDQNLRMRPNSELNRLPRHWDGNTLVIGHSENRSMMLLPSTDYTVSILGTARDSHGNELGETWTLRFTTTPMQVAIDNETPEVDDEASAESQEPTETASTEPSAEESDPTKEPTGDADTDGSAETNQPAGDQSSGAQSSDDEDTGGPVSGTRRPDPTQPAPTATPQPKPTQPSQEMPTEQDDEEERVQNTPAPTATPEPPEPTKPAEPEPTSTPQPEPTAEPETPANIADAPSEESGTIPVRGPFGEVYWGNQDVQEQLGQPTQEALSFVAAEQEFQHGLMFRQFHQDVNAIYIFVNGGGVQVRNLDYDPENDDYPGRDLGNGMYEPSGYFGKIWAESPQLAGALGNATSLHANEDVDGAIQQFADGLMIYSHGMVYVIRQDDTWSPYPVQSGDSGGFQDDNGSDEQQPDQTETPDGGASTPTPEVDDQDNSGETDESEFQETPDVEPTEAADPTPSPSAPDPTPEPTESGSQTGN